MSANGTILSDLSSSLADMVESVGPAVVRVDDGTRLNASGIVWSNEGQSSIVVATSHGVESDDQIAIDDGVTRHPAVVTGRDPDTDIAVLMVEGVQLRPVSRAPQMEVRTGHLALALGRPGNSASSGLQATMGIVGSRSETQTGGVAGYIVHTDATFYPGFSGGALVDTQGRLIGMINLMYGRGRGIAVGTPIVETVVSALLQHGRIKRGYLGVRTQSVTLHGAAQPGGVLIVQIDPNSPGARGGLLIGDVILGLNGAAISDVDDLRQSLRSQAAGQAIEVRLMRGGEEKQLTVVLGEEE